MSAADTRLYFAYGSNLHTPRMRARVPSAQTVAIARLGGFSLAFRKRGADGSAKCDLMPASEGVVWGAVYRIARAEQHRLDSAEGAGYFELAATVEGEAGSMAVFTYRARPGWLTAEPPRTWYRDIVLAGACEHGLPPAHIAAIEHAAAAPGPAVDP